MTADGLARVASRIRDAARVTAMTGAGVSAASGIPTFRGADGLWKKVRAETLATPEAFESDPKLVWEWYDWRRGMIRDAQPNAAHHVLARWLSSRSGMTLVTQNVDGLHERAVASVPRLRGSEVAGFHVANPPTAEPAEPRNPVLRLHGSIWHVRCWNACERGREDWLDQTVPLPTLPPRCPHCRGLVRPGVVWFGEGLDPRVLAAATAATACDVFLTIGTSSVVYPAAGLVHRAKTRGAFTVEINPDVTEATGLVDVALRGKAEEILPELDRVLKTS